MHQLDEQPQAHADVRAAPPSRIASTLRALPKRSAPGGAGPRRPNVARAALVFVAAAVAAGGIFIIGAAREIPRAAERGAASISEGVRGLQALDTSAAREHFGRARGAADGFSENPLSAAEGFFAGAPELFRGMSALAGAGISVAGDADYVAVHAVDAFLGTEGDAVLARLHRIAQSLEEIRDASQSLASHAERAGVGASFPELVIPFAFDADGAARFIRAGLSWAGVPEGRRIAVLFQNPLEMRPSGGFLGSFAEVYVRGGVIVSSTVRDILEADRTFAPNIIPPQPLQGVVRRWKAADANWFFDFPSSAAQVMRFLESSDFYRRAAVMFDGAIAVSPRVAADLLARTGPISVAGVGTLNADNVLTKLQDDVERRQAAGERFPKQALPALVESVRARLAALDAPAKQEIAGRIAEWLARRDVMLYVKDRALQGMIEQYGMGGEVFRLPEDFEGDYLAIADANVGGGKTDGVIAQRVTWESQLNADGAVTNHLVLARRHNGGASPYAWSRLPNDGYLQIFVPERAELENFSGGKKVAPPARPEYRRFAADPLLAELELGTEASAAFPHVTTRLEASRRVFATRLTVAPGEEAKVIMDYSHRLFVRPRDGTRYRFVFERQAGSVREYRFTVSAPVGFRFQENQLPVWTFATNDPPGRMIVDLTLERISE
ncbi:MAG: DUF4012 domain-containing protein [Candidatus Liptonbacteria bacterium]|nr:DUF4012 domain-containing protein [Candidatus Liptonbacteria bacterium]